MTFTHAQKKEFTKLKRALSQDVDVNARDQEGCTLLLYACGHSYGMSPSAEIAEYLIQQGADVDVKSDRGFTPLTEACAYGASDVVDCLLSAGADPNLPGQNDSTALQFAATSGYWTDDGPEIVSHLLGHGADPNILDEDQYNPLLKVLESPQYQLSIAKLLIEAGTDLNHVDRYERVALSIAAEKGDLELVKQLLSNGAKLDFINQHGKSALVTAMNYNHKDVVVYLLEQGAQRPNRGDLYGSSLFAYAARYGHLDLLDFIDVDIPDEILMDACCIAASEGQLEFFQSIVKRGIAIKENAEGLETLLMKAARHGNTDVAEFLLIHGALTYPWCTYLSMLSDLTMMYLLTHLIHCILNRASCFIFCI